MPWYKVFVFQCTLQPEQFYLLVNASGISRQAAIRAHHAVAGDDNGNLVFAHSAAHRLCRHPGQSPFCGHLPGNITIGTGLPYGMAARIAQTSFWKSEPVKCMGGVKSGFLPEK